MIQTTRLISSIWALTGLMSAGIGIGSVFGALILAVAKNPSLRGQLFSYAITIFIYKDTLMYIVLNICLFMVIFSVLALTLRYYDKRNTVYSDCKGFFIFLYNTAFTVFFKGLLLFLIVLISAAVMVYYGIGTALPAWNDAIFIDFIDPKIFRSIVMVLLTAAIIHMYITYALVPLLNLFNKLPKDVSFPNYIKLLFIILILLISAAVTFFLLLYAYFTHFVGTVYCDSDSYTTLLLSRDEVKIMMFRVLDTYYSPIRLMSGLHNVLYYVDAFCHYSDACTELDRNIDGLNFVQRCTAARNEGNITTEQWHALTKYHNTLDDTLTLFQRRFTPGIRSRENVLDYVKCIKVKWGK